MARRIKTLLATYAKAGGRDACLLLHAEDGRDAIARLARRGKGLPARVIPVEVHHIASVGLDVWLAALAWGASQVAVLATGDEAPQYRDALAFQMRLGDTIANALGYQGEHFRIVDGADVASRARCLAVAGRADRARRRDVRADAGEAHDRSAWRSSISRCTRRCRSR